MVSQYHITSELSSHEPGIHWYRISSGSLMKHVHIPDGRCITIYQISGLGLSPPLADTAHWLLTVTSALSCKTKL